MTRTATKWYTGKKRWKQRFYFPLMEFPWRNIGQNSAQSEKL